MFHSPQVRLPSSTHYAFLLGNMCLQDGWLHNEVTWFLADIHVDGLHCDITFTSRVIGALAATGYHGLALAAQ